MKIRTLLLAVCPVFILITDVEAQGTAFTYQGRLFDGTNAAKGIYDLRFTLNDAASGGSQSNPLTNSATAISNGLFTVTLNFGALFPGANRWLEIGVRTNGGGAFTTLTLRQAITATPYAITASNLTGTVSAGQLSGQLTGSQITNGAIGAAQVDNNAVQVRVTGTAPAGQFITGINADGSVNIASDTSDWKLSGNNVSPGQFLGSTNNQALAIKVNGLQALQVSPTVNDATHSGIVNLLGGSPGNYIAPGVYGSVIAGGGATFYFDAAYTNSIRADMSFLGGGGGNSIQTNAGFSFIGGGIKNSIGANSGTASVAGGYNNTIGSSASDTFIGGGAFNFIEAFAGDSVIVAGFGNHIRFNANVSTIGGGSGNEIRSNAWAAFIGGGDHNTISNSVSATIGAGYQNIVSVDYGTIGGGYRNWVNDTNGTIAGGYANTIQSSIGDGTIGGGHNNFISSQGAVIAGGIQSHIVDFSALAAIGGGYQNLIETNGFSGTIAGGNFNFLTAPYGVIGGGYFNTNFGSYATVPGGRYNRASGHFSFAAGQQAQALHNGTFVWSDSENTGFASTATNQFLIRAGGGVGINTNNPKATLDVNGSFRVGGGTTFGSLQAGLAQMPSDSSTAKTNFTFSFPKAFNSTPNVLVSARNASANVDDTFAVTVRTVTTTSCTVNIVRIDVAAGWGQHLFINWMAWE